MAALVDYRAILGPGERGILPVMAASTSQAQSTINFIKGVFEDVPAFAKLVDSMGSDTIALKNRVTIQVRPANFRTIRGITAVAAIAEECSMWQPDDFSSKNPDSEILHAIRPSLATTHGPLFVIGSPHARRGEMWKTFNKHFGAKGNSAILVANGATRDFNPTIPQSVIDAAYEEDAAVARAEWGGQFRDDLESYVSPEVIAACTDGGVHQREYKQGLQYSAHCDPSGARGDSFTCAIGHVEKGVGILDLLLEAKPPFSPESVVQEFCDT